MTKKEIKDLSKELMKEMGKVDLEMDLNIDEETLNKLSAKIVARFVSLRELTMWHDRLHMTQVDWDYIDMTEEEELISELAKCMTLMNVYTEKEEYEKCAVLKKRITTIKRKLKKYDQ